MMTTCYLASRFSRQHELRGYAADLRRDGITCSSRWLTGAHAWTGIDDQHVPHAAQARFAQDDLDDIAQAHVLVFFGEPPGEGGVRGGACVELGAALLSGKHVVVIAHRQNVFCCLPEVVFCPDWETASVYLQGLNVKSNGRVRAA